jgi:hypothetical protein
VRLFLIIGISSALITGATSGIGAALARLLARHIPQLFLTGRNATALTQLVTSLPNAQGYTCDLAQPDQRLQLIELIHREAPGLVINCAGSGLYGNPLHYETQASLETVELNVQALMEITIEAARTYVAKGKRGTIMNVSSVAGVMPMPGYAVYAATKAFVNSFSEAFDVEMRPQGVRVLAACPGEVNTQFRVRSSADVELQHSAMAMSADFAAKEIWWQIQRGKAVHIFDWRYRVAAIVRHLVPKRWLYKYIQKRQRGWQRKNA